MQHSYYVFLEEVVRGLCPYLKRELVISRVPMMIKVTFTTLKRRECGTHCCKICLFKTLESCDGSVEIFFCSLYVCDYNKYWFWSKDTSNMECNRVSLNVEVALFEW